MRTVILFLILISSIAIKAQIPLPGSFMYQGQGLSFGNNLHSFRTPADKKWILTPYSSISTGFGFFNGGSANFLAAPLGLQLDRRLNNNFYAFAGVSAMPAFVNFNRSFLSADVNKWQPNNGFLNSNSFGLYSGAELGLMYINDARTFSVSGSIGVQSSSYSLFPYQQIRTARKNTIPATKK